MRNALKAFWECVTDPGNVELGIAMIPLVLVLGILIEYTLVR